MAGYSFEGQNKFKETHTLLCPLCDKVTLYKGEKEPERCGRCGHSFKKPITVETFGGEKAKPSTHKQLRVYCRACNKKSIVWRNKKSNGRPPCPHCGEVAKLTVSTINAAGDCITAALWGSGYGSTVRQMPVTKPKKKVVACEECGLRHHYLLKLPTRCSRCGRKFS